MNNTMLDFIIGLLQEVADLLIDPPFSYFIGMILCIFSVKIIKTIIE